MARYKKTDRDEFSFLSARHFNFLIEYVKDYNHRRAAEASGFSVDTGVRLKERDDIKKALQIIQMRRLEESDITAEWLLMEAVDNHFLARQSGNLTASNAALRMVAQHTLVDAFAAQKVKISSADEVVARLKRGRDRASIENEVSFL